MCRGNRKRTGIGSTNNKAGFEKVAVEKKLGWRSFGSGSGGHLRCVLEEKTTRKQFESFAQTFLYFIIGSFSPNPANFDRQIGFSHNLQFGPSSNQFKKGSQDYLQAQR